MKRVYQFDNEGNYVQTFLMNDNDPIPSDCTINPIKTDLYKNKWVGSDWEEGATQDEINSIKAAAIPNETDPLRKQQVLMQQAIDGLILGGAL